MSIRLINSILIVVLAILVGTIFLVRRDYPTRNVELLPGMVSHVSYNAQSTNSNFADGKTLQRPVAGTIVRGFSPLPYNVTPEDAIRAGEELRSPLAAKDSTADLQRGATVFANVCSPCHGAGGKGDGVIPRHGFPPPPSLFAENAMKMKDGQVFHIITYGQKNMPSFATQVVRQDRWRVVKYIRTLQQQPIQKSIAAK